MQIISLIIAVLLLIIFIFPISTGVHNLGMAAGVFLGLCFGAEGLFYNKMSFTAQRYTVFALFVVSLILIFACAYVMKFGKNTATNQKTLIVLGCRVKGDVPSLALQKRADAAYFYLLKNPDCVAILSGGQGKDENISEAACLKKLLTDRGIAQSRLFCEELSTSTDENIRFSKIIIDENGFDTSVAIVTSEYHQLRAKHICEKNGLSFASISSKTEPLYLPTFLVRELMALINEKIK